MVRITASDFDPYPGEFLKEDLEEKIYYSNMMLAMDYMAKGEPEAAQEAMRNIYLSKHDAPPNFDAFSVYRSIQRNWEELVRLTKSNRYEVRKVMERKNLSQSPIILGEHHQRFLTPDEADLIIRKTQLFSVLSDAEYDLLKSVASIKTFFDHEIVFQKGSPIQEISVILKGFVVLSTNDSEKITEAEELARLTRGDTLGESFLMHKTYSLTAIATEFTELLCISRDDMERMIEKTPSLGVKILKMLLQSSSTKLYISNQKFKEAQKYNQSLADTIFRE